MGQVNGVADRMFRQSTVMTIEQYDGYIDSTDRTLGRQKYIQLKKGYTGHIEHSEVVGDNIILMISVRETDSEDVHFIRLSHNGQSLGSVPADSIYVLTVIDDIPAIPSLEDLDRL